MPAKDKRHELQWAADEFGIPVDTIKNYRGGICYNRLWVTTREAAEAASKTIKKQDRPINGGYSHGNSRGGIETYKDCFCVIC